ncbi:MAG: VIT domain-containing protein [Polyangiaceae bacterium]
MRIIHSGSRKRALLGTLALSIVASCTGAGVPPPEPVVGRAPEIVVATAPRRSPAHVDPPAPPPFQLTASDGSGLAIAEVSADVSIQDPVAVTQLKLVFENPEDRVIEGRFTINLPEGAALSRFAMRIDGRMQEAEVVEKQRARVTYEEFLHRRKDPALIEQGAGNQFAVRVFPIGMKEKKELVLTYSESLSGQTPYRLKLAGLSTVAKLSARVYVDGKIVAEKALEDSRPDDDLVVPLEAYSAVGPRAIGAGRRWVARVTVPEVEATPAPLEDVVVMVDTSASRVLDLGREVDAVLAFARSLAPEARLRVVSFDQTVTSFFEGLAGDFDAAAADQLRRQNALGASDLEGALTWLKGAYAPSESRSRRLVVFSDGVPTVGARDPKSMARAAEELAAHGFKRADAVVVGSLTDTSTLRGLVEGIRGEAGVVVSAELGMAKIAQKLTRGTLEGVAVSVPGATWVHPKTLDAQPGDSVLVHAEFDRARDDDIVINIGGTSIAPAISRGSSAVVERSLAVAKIAELTESSPESDEAVRKRIVELSLKHRIVSAYTSMLVLETEEDYKRFKIDRAARVELLAVVDGRVTVVEQARGPSPFEAAAGAPRASDAVFGGDSAPMDIGDSSASPNTGEGIGLGSIGTVGHGNSAAAGESYGTSLQPAQPRGAGAPQVRSSATEVSGRLAPEVIQRVIRQNFGRLRVCYENAVLASPTLGGRIGVVFVIGRDGAVDSVEVDSASTTLLTTDPLRTCLRDTFLQMNFPAPEGGIVRVYYPLSFDSSGGSGGSSTEAESQAPAYTGRFAGVMDAVRRGDQDLALEEAWDWRAASPEDVLSFVALGEAAEANGDNALAERAYGSIAELWSYRVDMRRFAGERLERVGTPSALALAVDTYRAALEDRRDQPTSARLLAMTLLKLDQPREAFGVLEEALAAHYPDGRFAGVLTVLKGDLGLAGAAWLAKEPDKKDAIEQRLSQADATLDPGGIRFVLVWETDANDVDLHVSDAAGEHAYYAHPRLASGGELSADITSGYGPEAFIIPKATGELAYPYRLGVNYYARGAMGFGMGKVQVVRHDGHGKLAFDERPFVLMSEQSTVDLGLVSAP